MTEAAAIELVWRKVDPRHWKVGSKGRRAQVWDELNEPLGFGPGALAAPPAGQIRVSGRWVAGVAALALAVGALALARRDAPPGGGEPFAVAKVEAAPAPPKPAARESAPVAREAQAAPAASAEQVEAASGVKVTRGGGGPPKALIIDVARALGAKPGPDAGPGESPPAQANP